MIETIYAHKSQSMTSTSTIEVYAARRKASRTQALRSSTGTEGHRGVGSATSRRAAKSAGVDCGVPEAPRRAIASPRDAHRADRNVLGPGQMTRTFSRLRGFPWSGQPAHGLERQPYAVAMVLRISTPHGFEKS